MLARAHINMRRPAEISRCRTGAGARDLLSLGSGAWSGECVWRGALASWGSVGSGVWRWGCLVQGTGRGWLSAAPLDSSLLEDYVLVEHRGEHREEHHEDDDVHRLHLVS